MNDANQTTKRQDNDQAVLSASSLEEKYSTLTTPQNPESPLNHDQIKIVDVNDDEYPNGSRVLVNTDHHIFNKLGTIRFVGKTYFKEGTWYGIELEEAVGKYNRIVISSRLSSLDYVIMFFRRTCKEHALDIISYIFLRLIDYLFRFREK